MRMIDDDEEEARAARRQNFTNDMYGRVCGRAVPAGASSASLTDWHDEEQGMLRFYAA